jgi:iron(III) transport system permease protein
MGGGFGAAPALLIALAALAPVLAVLASLFAPWGETIRHVAATLGGLYVGTTLALVFAVGAFSAALGVGAALLTAVFDFPLRRALSFCLALPLAVPAYLAAYAYSDLLGPFGALGGIAGVLPPIRSLAGAAFVLTATLYPYCYLTARAAFASRTSAALEAARTLGAAPREAIFRVLLPAARPAIVGGAALVMMETAAEFGVADYFGVPTLSVGIFRTWNSYGDLGAASQLASCLFLFSAALVAFEAAGRRGRSADAPRIGAGSARLPLKGPARIGTTLFCSALFILGFALPLAALITKSGDGGSFAGLAAALCNSALVAGAGAILTILAAVTLAYSARAQRSRAHGAAIRLATLGYAMPGMVVAIGVLALVAVLRAGAGVVATGIAALLFAYVVRFLTAGYNAVAGGFAGVDARIDEAARALGASGPKLVGAVHLPIMRRSLVAAAAIVFVDIVKELPATLILRDFNFETLATRVYRLAGDERLAEAAPNALLLIAVGALPILILNSLGERKAKA